MKIAYLGQQSWLLEEENTRILIDPVLTSSFGAPGQADFLIYPPRSPIDLSKIGSIAGVIVTNEHLDHFHLTSINMLPKGTPIILGSYTPSFVRESLEHNGYKIILSASHDPIRIGEIEIRLFNGSLDAPFWERRVYQPLINSLYDPKSTVLVQSDTLMSESFWDFLKTHPELSPRYFIATNNSQIPYLNAHGSMRNFYGDDDQEGIIIKVLYESLCVHMEKLPRVSHVFWSGGAYIFDNKDSIPFQSWISPEISAVVTKLSLGRDVRSLLPGRAFNTADQKETTELWTTLDEEKFFKYEKKRPQNIEEIEIPELTQPLTGPYLSHLDWEKDIKLIENEHVRLARLFSTSPFIKTLLSINNFLNSEMGPGRFLIIYDGPQKYGYQFNINNISFERVTIEENVLTKYPYGIEMFAADFAAVVKGKLQIWELASTRFRQWYLGEKIYSPLAYLYSFYSEQVRPDLARNITCLHYDQ